ncbi:ATP-binding protein [Hornefia porci]|uniref:Iron-sulfur cluster carrier protein n=1 Tax=Hornefia porci TaxID=2652292 RepID=A0A1Q9JKW7_9FIRM|nr:Mrp/NBP35 family ATP-binding protein [Hornefia porci]OLR56853.1 ATP-binding protein [Hornefia porci]
MADCNHDCGSCGESCGERQGGIPKAPMNSESNIRKVIGVVSGKGGVGKSSVTSMLAVAASHLGKQVAVMDADITGPSIPKAFGITDKAMGNDEIILPQATKSGIKTMSINLLLENETDPVVWRGPVLSNVIQQFWSNVVWGDIDVMFVDMPPGTGDVALTVYQTLPVDGIVIVTSPQELVGMIVEKAYKMAEMMNVPVLGIVENMSYFRCPDCGSEHAIFGESHVEEVAASYGIKNIAKLPIDPALAAACDSGTVEDYRTEAMDRLADALIR